jgi:pilus assembly protein CpaE
VSLKISLVGSHDRQLEDQLRGLATKAFVSTNLTALLAADPAAAQHAIVIDIREDGLVPASLSQVRRAHPHAGVILVAPRLDPSMMLDAMRAGVNEFIVEPVRADELTAAIHRLSDLLVAPVQGRVYAFVGAKGGVGTTTLAVNVSTALAKTKSGRVLMIDLHAAYGDAALFFGAEPRFSVLDALENIHRLDEAYFKGLLVHTKSGVDLLASSDRSMVMTIDAQRVRSLVDFASRHFDHVILDVPRSDSAILDALEGASQIVIIANQELSTVRGAARIATALRQRYGKERIQVVVSRYDTVAEIGQEDIERVVGGSIRHLFPSSYRQAVDALNKGRPVVVDNHNKLSASFEGFARSLAGVAKPASKDEKTTGLLGLFTGRR